MNKAFFYSSQQYYEGNIEKERELNREEERERKREN
jgi:hypothetical protein